MSGFHLLDGLYAVCDRTRAVLTAAIHGRLGDLDFGRHILAKESLPHVERIEQGLRYATAASHFSSAELRDLVKQVGIVEQPAAGSSAWLVAKAEQLGRIGQLRSVDSQVILASAHARMVFGLIPRLPPAAITWPSRRHSYLDIAVPRSEIEVLLRVEEIERNLWRVAQGQLQPDAGLRRTLAFYDTSARLGLTGELREH